MNWPGEHRPDACEDGFPTGDPSHRSPRSRYTSHGEKREVFLRVATTGHEVGNAQVNRGTRCSPPTFIRVRDGFISMDDTPTPTAAEQKKIRTRLHSFRDAFRGITVLFRTQTNASIHLAVFLSVLVAGICLYISATEWALVLLASGLVFSIEAVNTAIEELADEVSPDHRPRIGRAKDVAAGAVLFAAVSAAAIGCLVFLPKLLM